MNFLYVHENSIAFRKIDKSDAAKLLELKNESHFGTHTVTYANLSSQEKWIESISHDTRCPRDLVLMANYNGPIYKNDCGIFKIFNIDWQNRKAEVGWDIFQYFRGQGLGKKSVKAGVDFCFQILNLHRLDTQILITNEASLKCARAAGFQIDGRQDKAILKNGKYIDNLILGVLNESNI